MLRAGLVDAVALFVAPVVLGGDGRGLLGSLGVASLGEALQVRDLRSRPVGPDLLLEGELRELP